MAQMATPLNTASASRTRAMWVPREHGAWGMLLVPLATGAGVAAGRGAGSVGALLWFTVAAISLFWLRTPVESLLGSSVIRAKSPAERRSAYAAVAVICSISFLALAALFWKLQHLDLLAIGAVAGLAFACQADLKGQRKFRILAQVIGSIGLTSTAASAFYLVSGKFDRTAFVLWTLCWFFAAEQIMFVQLRIRGARLTSLRERLQRGKVYLVTIAAIVAAVVLFSLVRLNPLLSAIAFVPAIVRSTVWFTSRQTTLDVHKLGWSEVANAVIYSALIIAIFQTA